MTDTTQNMIIKFGIPFALIVLVVIWYALPRSADAPEEVTEPTSVIEEEATTTESQAEDNNPSTPTPVPTAPVAQQPIELGERMPADSPASALRYFVEAVEARDIERAVSYMHPNAKEQMRESLERDYSLVKNTVVTTYRTGTVSAAEMIEPKEGLYEIAVYPQGFAIPNLMRFVYDSASGEFVITEI